MERRYLDVRFDVTDLNGDQIGDLTLAVCAESKNSTGNVPWPEFETVTVELEQDEV
jgi:hypothetical protein